MSLQPIRFFSLLGLLLPTFAVAEVTRYEITERKPYSAGNTFGAVGAYEQIVGKVHFEIDPSAKHNQTIVDREHAVVNEQGRIEFESDLFILAPKNLRQGNGALLYDVNNRGNKLALRFFNDASGGNDPQDPGHGFLMRQGYTVVWSGWDGELLPGQRKLQLLAPLAKLKSQRIHGPVRYEISVENGDDGSTRQNINRAHHGAYPPTKAGLKSATLTWRLRSADPRVPIPREQFHLHVTRNDHAPAGQLPKVELELPAGFQSGYLYELIYEAKDPIVHGVSFAAVRDLVSSIKYGGGDEHPLLQDGDPVIQRAHAFGVSQSGRYLREFLYWGFNADAEQRRVFETLMPHVAGGGLGSFNHRFAQPTAFVTQHKLQDWPTDRFPFTYGISQDPHSRRRDSVLNRTLQHKQQPLVVHTQSAAEYWTRSGSLVHTDPLGRRDVDLPKNVRVFAFGGTQHGPASFPPNRGKGQTLANPGDYRPFLRALLSAMDEWSRTGRSLPASVYPRLANATLTDWQADSTGFPALPGIRYPEVIQQPSYLDFGPNFYDQGVISQQPPSVHAAYKVLVPRCDVDGNAVGCLSPPEVQVPLATFTGWNLRHRQAGAENELVGLQGSYIPFPIDETERQRTGDPRLSVAARYPSQQNYLDRVQEVCQQLVQDRYLLAEDVARTVERQRGRSQSLFAKIQPDNP